MTKAELEARVEELERINQELLEAAEKQKADNQDAPIDVPPIQVAQYDPNLLVSCVAVLRDRMTGATISEDEFNQLAPMFVKQAKDLYQMLVE